MDGKDFLENELILKLVKELTENKKIEGEFDAQDASKLDSSIQKFMQLTGEREKYLFDVLEKDYDDLYKFIFHRCGDSPRTCFRVPSDLINFTMIRYFPKNLEEYFHIPGGSKKLAKTMANAMKNVYSEAIGKISPHPVFNPMPSMETPMLVDEKDFHKDKTESGVDFYSVERSIELFCGLQTESLLKINLPIKMNLKNSLPKINECLRYLKDDKKINQQMAKKNAMSMAYCMVGFDAKEEPYVAIRCYNDKKRVIRLDISGKIFHCGYEN